MNLGRVPLRDPSNSSFWLCPCSSKPSAIQRFSKRRPPFPETWLRWMTKLTFLIHSRSPRKTLGTLPVVFVGFLHSSSFSTNKLARSCDLGAMDYSLTTMWPLFASRCARQIPYRSHAQHGLTSEGIFQRLSNNRIARRLGMHQKAIDSTHACCPPCRHESSGGWNQQLETRSQ